LDNLGFPHEIIFTTDEIYKTIIDQGLISPLEDQSKLDMVLGTQLRFTKDPLTLGKLEYGKKLQVPQIRNTTKY
jgi:hypothetical protein